MKILLQSSRLVLTPESDQEQTALKEWITANDGVAFSVTATPDPGAALIALGPRAEAREPLNVTSSSPDPIRLISNFAPTPFVLDGVSYACVEAFWQSLRFPVEERPRIAVLDGPAAKQEVDRQPYGACIFYDGQAIAVGTYEHWRLMQRACQAKFEQNADARAALLATGDRPLTHSMQPDSRTIPGVVMAEIWMKLRESLRRR